MAREQELLLEEFTRFVGLLNNRTDLTVQHAKAWTMDELMENIHPVSGTHQQQQCLIDPFCIVTKVTQSNASRCDARDVVTNSTDRCPLQTEVGGELGVERCSLWRPTVLHG